ncbi:hypothetical protein ITJ57_19015 [Plantibacter sp. VKM Ac-2880]|uniref:hypothetical protein n=1 Tax=Plantibacter sp. VKM Ac-2880 TaxID=2783827 RepID=UPI00188ED8F2|nr:hypothetical protein [Plantibacter sp. VKM Ac-2880]MBF4570864.1 hypothetical protein [Plantibacter sp. VKM Ac-2880]
MTDLHRSAMDRNPHRMMAFWRSAVDHLLIRPFALIGVLIGGVFAVIMIAVTGGFALLVLFAVAGLTLVGLVE